MLLCVVKGLPTLLADRDGPLGLRASSYEAMRCRVVMGGLAADVSIGGQPSERCQAVRGSGRQPRSGSAPREQLVGLAGDVTLPRTHIIHVVGESFFGVRHHDVDAGPVVAAHASENDPPERMVRLPVPGATEPMPAAVSPMRCVEGRDAAQVRPRGFVTDPFRVVTGGDQQDRGGVDSDPVTGERGGCGLGDEVGEHDIEGVHGVADREGPSAEGPHREFRCASSPGSPSARGRRAGGDALGEVRFGDVTELFAQAVRGW